MINLEKLRPLAQHNSTGSAALLTVVMLLVMMTLLIFYNARVTTFEQRISGNDRRAKLAHHTAEAGNAHAMRFLNKYNRELASQDPVDGWLVEGGTTQRWTPCEGDEVKPHPCAYAPSETEPKARADSFVRENVYYYNFGGSSDLPIPIMEEFAEENEDTDYTVQALLCVIDFDKDVYVPGNLATYAKCDAFETGVAPVSDLAAIKLISTGIADDGSGEAIIEKLIGNIHSGSGSPGVPLSVTAGTQATGTVSIVAAPNAGGSGAPISIWSGNDVDFVGGASSSTCEFETYLQTQKSSEWETILLSGGETVTVCNKCNCPDTIEEGALSYPNTGEGAREYIDIVDEDPNFPDDLFYYFFGVARSEWPDVRKSFDERIPNCNGLDEDSGFLTQEGEPSDGYIWVDGYCDLPANQQIGTAENPIILMTPDGIKANANTVLFGVMLILDPDVPPDLQAPGSIPATLNGGPIFYGSILTDPGGSPFNGGYTLVYLEEILSRVPNFFIMGNFPGSWSDLAQSD